MAAVKEVDADATKYCPSCNRTKKMKTNFYKSNNLEKYPEGYMDQCKDCMTMLVDNWDPKTYTWILEEADVPYIPDEWDKLMKTYAKDPTEVKGTTIIGRYLSKMKLTQHRDFRWKDTEFLQELKNKKIKESMIRQGYEAREIAMAIEKASIAPSEKPEIEIGGLSQGLSYNPNALSYFDKQNGFTEEDFKIDLTDEEKLMLRLKWGATYSLAEWVQLEQLYNDFCNSYDIRSAGHIDTLKLICKTSLQANKLIDAGDKKSIVPVKSL